MIRALMWILSAVVAPWLLIGGVVALMFGTAVMEVVAVELAGIGLVMLGGLWLIDDLAGPRQ